MHSDPRRNIDATCGPGRNSRKSLMQGCRCGYRSEAKRFRPMEAPRLSTNLWLRGIWPRKCAERPRGDLVMLRTGALPYAVATWNSAIPCCGLNVEWVHKEENDKSSNHRELIVVTVRLYVGSQTSSGNPSDSRRSSSTHRGVYTVRILCESILYYVV